MADFSRVTYTYYSSTLGRAVIPNEAAFNALILENVQQMKRLEPYIEELETDGEIKAVCMMIEAQYKAEALKSGKASNSIASESLGGHSITYGSTQSNKLTELDAVSTKTAKAEAIKLFCRFNIGVK